MTRERLARATAIAEGCQDAYSFDAYGEAEWAKSARMLARRGFSDQEIEAILRSKWTRWSRDRAGRYKGTAADLARFVGTSTPGCPEVEELVIGTFGWRAEA